MKKTVVKNTEEKSRCNDFYKTFLFLLFSSFDNLLRDLILWDWLKVLIFISIFFFLKRVSEGRFLLEVQRCVLLGFILDFFIWVFYLRVPSLYLSIFVVRGASVLGIFRGITNFSHLCQFFYRKSHLGRCFYSILCIPLLILGI